jgi:N-sulfoglucosamine sulfohydrolase
LIRKTLFAVTCLVATFGFWNTESIIAADAPARRNVILIVADDLGFQIGAYGDKAAKTPGLDRLAATGTRFTRAHCTTASCSASRSVLLTGLHNHTTGQLGLAHDVHHFAAYSSVQSLPVMLAQAGYATCSIGKHHISPESVFHFENYRNAGIQGARNSSTMAANAIQWMNETTDKPFFLYYCSSDPHRGVGPGGFGNRNPKGGAPYSGCEPVTFDPQAIDVPPWLPDLPEVRAELAEYYQAIHRFDQGVAQLLDYLESSGRAKDTLVLFLSDNGPPFPGAKTTLYQPGMHLPLLVRNPLVGEPGATCAARISWTDITPTILDFCQVTPAPAPPIIPGPNDMNKESPRPRPPEPVKFHGRSFLSAMAQTHPEGWDTLYASHSFHEITMYYPMRVIIEGNHKLIFNIAHQLPYPFASDLQESATWQAVTKLGVSHYGQRTVDAYLHRPRFELYDLQSDPQETVNLADDPAHAKQLEQMQTQLHEWQKETHDPWTLKWDYE